jgi:hypothetical protein
MTTIDDYLSKLPDDRRAAIVKVRDVINANLPAGYEERLQYGMISWCVPESVLPAKDVYNKQPLALASLASQKSHMAVYLLSVYGDASLRSWFEKAYKQSGKKLDMGASCVRFKSLDALPLDVIGQAVSKVPVASYVDAYWKVRGTTKTGAKKSAATTSTAKTRTANMSAAKKTGAAKTAAKKTATKKTAAKKTAATKTTKRR